MINAASKDMAAVGFKMPPVKFQKQDQRGPEYGSFWAFNVVGTTEEIDVEKHDLDGKRMYRMRFENLNEFLKWAHEET